METFWALTQTFQSGSRKCCCERGRTIPVHVKSTAENGLRRSAVLTVDGRQWLGWTSNDLVLMRKEGGELTAVTSLLTTQVTADPVWHSTRQLPADPLLTFVFSDQLIFTVFSYRVLILIPMPLRMYLLFHRIP